MDNQEQNESHNVCLIFVYDIFVIPVVVFGLSWNK